MKSDEALLRLRTLVHRRLAGSDAEMLKDDEIQEVLRDNNDQDAAEKIARTIRFRGFWKVFRRRT